jgi:uncharacterized membrane protein
MNSVSSAQKLPTTIPEYLEHLKRSLAGADPALIQDALYDAEDYLRSELAQPSNRGKSEAEVIAAVASSYGAPDEVADIYRDTEVKVQTALRTPPPPKPRSLLGRFFGVVIDPRTYASLFYMVLALATGIFYFTWVVTGLSLSLGLSILIIGIPFAILFFGSVHVLSLVEGRLVEVMLGERMPRRPVYSGPKNGWIERIGMMFADPRNWSSMLYMLLMLPLGIVYFTLAVTLLTTSLAFMAAPIAVWLGFAELNTDFEHGWLFIDHFGGTVHTAYDYWILPVLCIVGFLLLFATLHVARGIGKLHGLFAKHLLVKIAQSA